MRKFYSSLIALALMMVSTMAKAQVEYDAVIESDPIDSWVAGQQSFDAAELATAMGTDVETLKALLLDGENVVGGNVFLDLGQERTNAYTGNANEFWMNNAGVPQGYGDEGTSWFVGVEFEPAGDDFSDRVNVYVGQMPGVFNAITEDTELKCKVVLNNPVPTHVSEAVFNVTQKIKAPKAKPEPTTSFSALEIVKEYSVTLTFTEGKSYENNTAEVDMSDIYNAFGITADDIDGDVKSITMTRSIAKDDNETYAFTDGLELAHDGSFDGWFGRFYSYDEATDTETLFPLNALHGWSTNATFYFQSPKLTEGTFTFSNGQYPGTLKAGDADKAEVYLVWGTKAAKLTITLDVQEVPVLPLDQMTKVGEQTLSAEAIRGNYVSVDVDFDLADVLAKLGCAVDDVVEWQLKDENSLVDPTEKDYWLNEAGYSETWGNNACAKVYPSGEDTHLLSSGKFTLMQMAGVYGDITEDKGPFPMKYILAYGTNYYYITINYTVKAPKQADVYERVGLEEITMEIVPSADTYPWGDPLPQIDMEAIAAAIESSNYVLYADKWNEDKQALVWSDEHTLSDSGGGFWWGATTYEDSEHRVVVDNAGWSPSFKNAFGIGLTTSGLVQWYQFPGECEVGDTYTANIYFANDDNGKYVQYVLTVNYVAEIVELEEVGQEDIVIAIAPNAEGSWTQANDFKSALEAIGVTADNYDSGNWYAKRGDQWVAISDFDLEAFAFDATGKLVSSESDARVYTIWYDSEEGVFMISFFGEDVPETMEYKVTLGYRYENKMYSFNFVLADPTTAAHIMQIAGDATKAGNIYDMSGRLVRRNANAAGLAKGLYIVNGTKVLVK